MIDILDKTGYPISKHDKVLVDGYTDIWIVYSFSSIPNQEVLVFNKPRPDGASWYDSISPKVCTVIIENDPVEFVKRLPV